MPRRKLSVIMIEPRGLRAEAAARHCGISIAHLTQHGPKPFRVGRVVIWDRRRLDAWIEQLNLLDAPMTPDEELAWRIMDGRRAADREMRVRHRDGDQCTAADCPKPNRGKGYQNLIVSPIIDPRRGGSQADQNYRTLCGPCDKRLSWEAKYLGLNDK